MKFVTFNDMSPGMVLYPVDDVNSTEIKNVESIVVLKETIPPGNNVLGRNKRGMKYVAMHDPHMGFCMSSWHTSDDDLWLLVEDESILNRIREDVRASIDFMQKELALVKEWVEEYV